MKAPLYKDHPSANETIIMAFQITPTTAKLMINTLHGRFAWDRKPELECDQLLLAFIARMVKQCAA